MKRLFLTGPVGCGKSTSIAEALGEHLPKAGGFLTVRRRDETGRAVSYSLQRTDGSDAHVFLDYTEKPYKMHLDVFDTHGTALLKEACAYPFVVLDEIGGIELLCKGFKAELEHFLRSGIPCIGVMKGAGPASNMICKLGLGDEYTSAAEELREWMRRDPDTMLYECGKFDPEGLRLARQWVNEFAASGK